jgi:hypothetical protein
MTAAICPYCRTKIGDDNPSFACEGCGTIHHADCYAENGGCTIFGCSKAPADEPKLSVSSPELLAVGTQTTATVIETRVAPPPPPPPSRVGETTAEAGVVSAPAETISANNTNHDPATVAEWRQFSNTVVPSIFGGFETSRPPREVAPAPSLPKSRTTFILLGALLGAFGAHSFYSGDKKKGWMQLAITGLTLGFAGPMVWVWAVIDICTINQDRQGVQFEA